MADALRLSVPHEACKERLWGRTLVLPSSVLFRSLSLYQGTVLSCTLCTLAAKEASWVRSSRMMRSMYRCEGARPEAVYSMCRSGSSSTSRSLQGHNPASGPRCC